MRIRDRYYVCDRNNTVRCHTLATPWPHPGQAEEYDCLFPLTGLLFNAASGSCEWAAQVTTATSNCTSAQLFPHLQFL